MRRIALALLASSLWLPLVSAACGGGDDAGAPASPSAEPAAGTASPAPDDLVAITVEGASASATVYVELARTEVEVQTGLMHREHMDEDRGMLFVFESPSNIGFWMKNTLIPLDIAYMDEEGRIREIHRGEPLNEELLRPVLPYSYVLEVNAGWFERHGLGPGDRAVIPPDLGGG